MTESLQHILTGSLRKEKLILFLKKNPDLFDEVITVSLGNDKPQAWRATWLLGHCITGDDKRIRPHINSIFKVLLEKGDGHQREFLKILRRMKLNEKQEGILFDKAIKIWEDINKSASVRSFAFLVIAETVEKYPELLSEVEFLTQAHYVETLTPGIRHSIIKTINKLLKSN